MYPVRLGYKKAIFQINKLLKNEHYSEALVTSMFTVEKTLRRTLRQIVVSAGFASKYADKIVGNIKGLDTLKKSWEIYEPNNKKLTDIIPASDWSLFKDGATKRNKMIHGERVYKLKTCEKEAKDILEALDRLMKNFNNIYGYSGWKPYKKRVKHQLHRKPIVKLHPKNHFNKDAKICDMNPGLSTSIDVSEPVKR